MRAAKTEPAGPAPTTQTSAIGRGRLDPDRLGLRREPQIGFEAIVQPAADIVASRPTASQNLVMAAAAAQVARPAGSARLLSVNVPAREPIPLARPVDPFRERAHPSVRVADEAVAGGEFAVRRYA